MPFLHAAVFAALVACGGSGGDSGGGGSGDSGTDDSSDTVSKPGCAGRAGSLNQAGKNYTRVLSTGSCVTVYFETGNSSLNDDRDALLADLSTAFGKIDRRLSVKNLVLLVNTDAGMIDPVLGVEGGAYAAKKVQIAVDYVVATDQTISYVVAREVHRSRRMQDNALDETLLQALVSEGMAIAFAVETAELAVLPDRVTAIAAADYDDVTTAALSELNAATYDFGEWFLGSGALAQYAGYTLGYDIVQRFLSRHPGSSAAYAFAVDAAEFAGYVEELDGSDPAKELKVSQSVRTPDIPGLPPDLEQVPVAELSAQANRMRGDGFVEGLTHHKTVALTFDDGPAFYSRQFLDLLALNDVRATFFLIGTNLQQSPQTALDAQREGHTLANHTLQHDHNSARDPAELWRNSLNKTNDIFEDLLGFRPRLFRPSYGEVSDGQISYLSGKNMKTILWSIDTRDWYTSVVDTADIIAAANDNMHEEAIILMHDGGGNRQNTLDAVQSIIDHYKANGYTFVTVDRMLGVSKTL